MKSDLCKFTSKYEKSQTVRETIGRETQWLCNQIKLFFDELISGYLLATTNILMHPFKDLHILVSWCWVVYFVDLLCL